MTLEANSFTLNDAYITLSDESCATCGKRGGFIYLITCERVCFECMLENRRWKPREEVDEEWEYFGAPYTNPRLAPSVMTRPGLYGTPGGYYRHYVSSPRTSSNAWVSKKLCSRLWDTKLCDHKGSLHWIKSYSHTPWFVTPFFVSVSVPLVQSDRRDIDEVN